MRSSRITSIVALTGITLGMIGCGSSPPKSPNTKRTSVSALEKALPNLAVFDITSCSYTVTSRTSRSIVPSPSDTLLELVGHATISDTGAERIRMGFEWEPVKRDQIPPELLSIMPPGPASFSRGLNRTFDSNGTYAHGVVIVLAEDWSKLYFVTRDRDHPIE